MNREWSSLQKAIFDHVAALIRGCEGNLVVSATAGSGKTTTIEECAKFAPEGSVFLAFNKSIQLELRDRLPGHMRVETFHKYGKDYLYERLGKFKINAYKVDDIIKEEFKTYAPEAYSFRQIVGLLKGAGYGVGRKLGKAEVKDFVQNSEVSFGETLGIDTVVDITLKVFKRSVATLDVVDFDDMLYLPVWFNEKYGWELNKVPLVFIDELQDTNTIQRMLLKLFTDKVVGVGDRHQAIYGFRGADSNSMDLFKREWGAQELPLSISYRCPVRVVEEARQFDEKMDWREGADVGAIRWERRDAAYELARKGEEALVLCRNNAPLFGVALRLLKEGVPFSISDKFPKRLISFLKGFQAKSVADLKQKLYKWWSEEKGRLEKEGQFGLLRVNEEKVDVLLFLAGHCSSVKGLYDLLYELCSKSSGVQLSTVHGAKGLEADYVGLLCPELIPSKYAVSQSQLAQEDNLKFVAITRAKKELWYLSDEMDDPCSTGGE